MVGFHICWATHVVAQHSRRSPHTFKMVAHCHLQWTYMLSATFLLVLRDISLFLRAWSQQKVRHVLKMIWRRCVRRSWRVGSGSTEEAIVGHTQNIAKHTGIIPSLLHHFANNSKQECSIFKRFLHFYTFGRASGGGREGDTQIRKSDQSRTAEYTGLM